MEVVIIRLTPYREKDYIVNALSKEEGIITFRATGALNVKSKFAGKLFLYALVDVESVSYTHLKFLFTHGLLHLLGYDHTNEKEEQVMITLQDQIIGKRGGKK